LLCCGGLRLLLIVRRLSQFSAFLARLLLRLQHGYFLRLFLRFANRGKTVRLRPCTYGFTVIFKP
jgi:hypothetical protein